MTGVKGLLTRTCHDRQALDHITCFSNKRTDEEEVRDRYDQLVEQGWRVPVG